MIFIKFVLLTLFIIVGLSFGFTKNLTIIDRSYTVSAQSPITTPPSLPKTSAVSGTITNVLKFIFGVAGAISVLMVTLGGITYITSNGNPQAVAKAKDTILYAVIGLVISISAFAIVTFVIGRL